MMKAGGVIEESACFFLDLFHNLTIEFLCIKAYNRKVKTDRPVGRNLSGENPQQNGEKI